MIWILFPSKNVLQSYFVKWQKTPTTVVAPTFIAMLQEMLQVCYENTKITCFRGNVVKLL